MPAKKPAPLGTLAALAESGRAVYIVCDACGCVKKANLYAIATKAGWRASIDDVAKRLTCECKHRGAKLTFEEPPMGRRVCPRCLRLY